MSVLSTRTLAISWKIAPVASCCPNAPKAPCDPVARACRFVNEVAMVCCHTTSGLSAAVSWTTACDTRSPTSWTVGIGGVTGLTAITPALAIATPATMNLVLRRVDGEWLGEKS